MKIPGQADCQKVKGIALNETLWGETVPPGAISEGRGIQGRLALAVY